jgi:dienelactone hydrolase
MRVIGAVALVACGPEDHQPRDTEVIATDTATPIVPPIDPSTTDAPDPSCTALGCLRSEESLGVATRSDITPFLYGGVEVDNGYEVVAIEYLTEAGTATATVTLPLDLAGPPPEDGFPVVVNAHGTIGVDDPCQLTGTIGGLGLAALFGGRGAIGVAPDYPGLGTPGFHRYLEARSEATSVLDAVRAAIHLAHHREVTTNERAAVVGLSQGGHAVLAAAALHDRYAPELDIRAFGAAAPANVYEEHWRSGVSVDGEHLVQHALLLWSFAEVSGADSSAMWAAGIANGIDTHLTTRCAWSPALGPEPLLADGFPTSAEQVFSAALLAEYTTGAWDTFAFAGERFDVNRITPWLSLGAQTAPLAIWQGTLDTTVLPWMTEDLVADLRAGGIQVDLHLVDGGTHTTTAFGFLAVPELATAESVAWVQDLLAQGGGE